MVHKAIVLLSGGVDSVTCLYWALKQGYQVIILTLNYKSRPGKEKEITRSFASLLHLQLVELDIPFLRSAADLLKENFPADYKDIYDDGYIPAKNLVFYSIACFFAEALGAEYIIGGHIAHDGEIFPDATRPYFNEFESLINKSLVSDIKPSPKILTPLITLSKEEVGKLAKNLNVPLDKTWSCYKDDEEQCGTCLSCLERNKAMQQFKT